MRSRAKPAKNAKNSSMDENRIATLVVDCALEIHKELGPGLLESVYEGLLINFGGELLKGNVERLANELDELTL